MLLSKSALFLFIVIGSSSCQKFWHSNFMGLSDRPRNGMYNVYYLTLRVNSRIVLKISEFILKNVSLDQKFSLNTTVDYWISLNTRWSSFAAGVSNETILILNFTRTDDPRDFNVSWKSKSRIF